MLFDGRPNHAGTGNAHVDDAVRLAGTVESAGHEGIVLGSVAEHHQLGGADALPVSSALGGLQNDAAHLFHGVHVDARLGGAYVYRGAHQFGLVQCLRDALDQSVVSGAKALVDQSGVAADEVDAHGVSGFVQGLGEADGGRGGACSGDHGDGGDGDPLVDDGNAVLPGNVLAGLYQILGIAADLVIDLLGCPVRIGIDAVQQGDAHGDGADV